MTSTDRLSWFWLPCALLISSVTAQAQTPPPRFPNILLVTVDTLRADRLGSYGHDRDTSPSIDSLVQQGARFSETRCVEPLTAPSLVSMLTSVYPHNHGASRNGLEIHPGLPSVSKALKKRGFSTAAFVSNWTLKDRLSGIGEHFDDYQEVFTSKRWFGLLKSEATARDVTAAASDWIRNHHRTEGRRPFLAWVHYSEPHAPYRLHSEYADRLGLSTSGEVSRSDRYDTEVAFVDEAIGNLLDQVREIYPKEHTLILFTSDHGENLGEHAYWGHGRHLWEESLRIPFAITWPGNLKAQTIATPASNMDVAPTILSLLGLPVPDTFQGHDWTSVLRQSEPPPERRATFHQAHKGAVQSSQDIERSRRRGLLEVGLIEAGKKETLRIKGGLQRHLYDLNSPQGEAKNLTTVGSAPSQLLAEWLEKVQQGLQASDIQPTPALDPEAEEKLRSLGYLE